MARMKDRTCTSSEGRQALGQLRRAALRGDVAAFDSLAEQLIGPALRRARGAHEKKRKRTI